MSQWFYAQDGQRQGPIPESDLVAMLQSGKLQADTLVWTEGLDEWTAARDVETLVSTATTPPPVPVAQSSPYRSGIADASIQRTGDIPKDLSAFAWYLDAWKKYAVFQGRSRRKAFWMFWLFDTIFTIAAMFIDGVTENELGVFNLIYTLATIVPYCAVSVRRMHDAGRSGWWILVPIVNLVFLCTDSQPGENEYGPNPKAAQD